MVTSVLQFCSISSFTKNTVGNARRQILGYNPYMPKIPAGNASSFQTIGVMEITGDSLEKHLPKKELGTVPPTA
jgi:hypothetical protein